MSIGTLKAILYENHVRVDFKQVLEKYVLFPYWLPQLG